MRSIKKVMVIGLDCLAPDLVFTKWRYELPVLSGLMNRGVYGPLESTIPPITCPAWMSMVTSKDPGQLGFYGFRNRKDYSYGGLSIVNSTAVKVPTVWDILGQHGKKVLLLGVPQTYPPKPVNGYMVAGFLTPDLKANFTYPWGFKKEITEEIGKYIFDVREFRTDKKDRLLEDIYRMTEKRFSLARHMVTTKEWDFFMMVEMGPDRIQHGFWKFFDTNHPKYQPGNPYETAVKEYYVYLDSMVGQLIEAAGQDVTVMVVSDHGAKGMVGGICINEWLLREGYLVVKRMPDRPTRLEEIEIDWSKTRAWGYGGYYGRLILNVRGREPEGVIPPDKVEDVRAELKAKLEAMTDEEGRFLGTKVFFPDETYREVQNIPPDFIIYFGGLRWRSQGLLGTESIYTYENDTGPDDANHDSLGTFILATEAGEGGRYLEGLHITDVTPTILHMMGIEPPPGLVGKSVVKEGEAVYSPEEQARIEKRLADLGYL